VVSGHGSPAYELVHTHKQQQQQQHQYVSLHNNNGMSEYVPRRGSGMMAEGHLMGLAGVDGLVGGLGWMNGVTMGIPIPSGLHNGGL